MEREQKLDFSTPIVRNIQNNDLYEYLGGNDFLNLRTRTKGTVDDETARKIFRVNLDATLIISKYPNVKNMINILGLKNVND